MRKYLASLFCLLSVVPVLADPARDLVGKTYQVETTPDGAINVAIDFNRVGYGVVSPSRMIPEGGGLSAYRIETLADTKGVSVILVARLRAHLTPTVDEWLVTAAVAADKVSSDSNMTFDCPGNSGVAPIAQFVYYDEQPKGRPIRKMAAGFTLDRRTGQIAPIAPKPVPSCKATEDPL